MSNLDDMKFFTREDDYALALYVIYLLSDNPKYSTLSELSFLLDNDSLKNFLKYYGGTTITVPTVSRVNLELRCIMYYQYVELEGLSRDEAISKAGLQDVSNNIISSRYRMISNVLEKYNLGRKHES